MGAAYSQGIAPYLAQFPRPAAEAEALCAAVATRGRGLRIVDLGAGLGASSLALAAAGHRLIAIEPDAEMAAVLGARLAAAAELRERVALLPRSEALPAGETELLICQSVLHLLPEAEQLALLREAARLLAPGSELWLELPLPSRLRQPQPWGLLAEQPLGGLRLQLHREMYGLPDGGWQTNWRFELRQGEQLLHEIGSRYSWQLLDEARLQALAAAAGLRLLAIGADWVQSRRFDGDSESYGYPRMVHADA